MVVSPEGSIHYKGDIVIPDTVEQDGSKYAVTAIGDGAFMECTLTSLQLPQKTLKRIEPCAFYRAGGLTTVDIPETVTFIGSYAFEITTLKQLHIPASVTEMENHAITGCPELESVTVAEGNEYFGVYDGVLMDKAQTRLVVYPAKREGTSYAVPATVTSIDDFAFQYLTMLKTLTIPAGVTTLTGAMFSNSTSLAEINVEAGNAAYCSEEGVVYTADKETLCIYPAAKTTKQFTPCAGVKTIGESAFSDAVNLESVTLPEGVTTIGTSAFIRCKALLHVNFAESVTTMDVGAFANCESLESIMLPPHLTEIPTSLFHRCYSLRSVTIPADVSSIGLALFVDCVNMEEVTCLATTPPVAAIYSFYSLQPNQVKLYVPADAIEAYKAAAVWKDFNVQPIAKMERMKIGEVYYNLDLLTMTAEVTPQYYRSDANYAALSGAIIIPESVSYEGQEYRVTGIGDGAFSYCDITEVSFPESVTTIGPNAFFECEKLGRVDIHNSIKSIGHDAFAYCYALTDVTLGSGLKTLEDDTFFGCHSLTSFTIPDNIVSVGARVFSNCSSLKTVRIGSGVTSIGIINLDGSLEEISVSEENPAFCSVDGVLFNKDKSTLIMYPIGRTGAYTIPSSVKTIKRNSFMDCTGLTSVTLPDGVEKIDTATFLACTGLGEVIIPNSVTTICASAFAYCKAMETLIIGSGVTTIESKTFMLCSRLTSIYNLAVMPQEVDGMTFLPVPSACVLYVPDESVEL